MKFLDFVRYGAIKADLRSTDKEGVIRELVDGFMETGDVSEKNLKDVIAEVLCREKLGTTGIGRGVAVPHAKHSSIVQTVGTIGVSSQGVSFDSLDGVPVKIFFLLLSPIEQTERHLRTLEKISRHLQDEMFCRLLRQSSTTDAVEQLLSEIDGEG